WQRLLSAPSHPVRFRCAPRSRSGERKSARASARPPGVPAECRDAAKAHGYADSSKLGLEFLFEERRTTFASPAELQGEQRQNMGHGRFQFRYQPLGPPAEKCVKNHRWNT